MFRSLLFCLRLIVAWSLLVLVAFLLVDWIWSPLGRLVRPLVLVAIVFVVIRAHSHLVRVRMIARKLSGAALASRQRRQIEVPFRAEDAVDLLEAAIRERPGVDHVESTRNHLQIRATACYADPYDLAQLGRYRPDALDGQPAQPDPGNGQSRRRQQQSPSDR